LNCEPLLLHINKMAVFEERNNRKGKNTVEYISLRMNFKSLTDTLQYNLPVVAAVLFSKSLIPTPEISGCSEKYEKASKLMTIVLSTVESDTKAYKTFVDALTELGEDKIVETLTASKDLNAPPTASNYEVPSFMKRSPNPHSPSSNGNSLDQSLASKGSLPNQSPAVSKSKSNDSYASEKDSAFNEDQSIISSVHDEDYQHIGAEGSDNAEDGSGSGSFADALPAVMATSDANLDSNEYEFSSPINFLAPSDNDEGLNVSTHYLPTPVTAMASSDGLTNSKPVYAQSGTDSYYGYLSEKASMEKIQKQQEAEIGCLRKQDSLKADELMKLKGNMERASLEQDRILKEKDDMILKLQKDHKYKDEVIAKLEIDKAKIETQMSELEQEYQGVKDRQMEMLKQFKEKEARLKQELEDVKKSEEKAVNDRQKIEKELIEIKFEREREMRKLELRNHELEKIELKLHSEIEKQKVKKEKEIAEKDKEIAEKDKAFAEQGTLLANSQKELAEKEKKNLEMKVEELEKKIGSMQMNEHSQ